MLRRQKSYQVLPDLQKIDFDLIKTLPEAEQIDKMQAIQQAIEWRDGLPHLYGYPWYDWAIDFFESLNRECFLCSANQVSKSSTLIRKMIHWATGVYWDENFWKERWPGLLPGQKPNQFWYLYPTLDVASVEYETKWEPLFLPRGKFKDHPIFGWEPQFESGKKIRAIRFKSGVTIYFKAYSQKAQDLQTGTVFMVGADEEMPVNLLPELGARLNASDGYFNMVFTATLGQVYWEQTMEPKTPSEEKHVDALKIQVSLYDAMKYEDGTPSPWTEEKIKRAIAKCPTQSEVQRRIFGKFVKSEGLRYESFDRIKNVTPAHPLPAHWHTYTGVDMGSGGKSGHPAAIVFVGVSPDYKHGRVYLTWRGDGISTTSTDVLNKYRELKGKRIPVAQKYDWAAKDFFLVAVNQGESFTPADKGRDAGIGLLNTLFKTGMLKIQGGDSENEKLISELASISVNADKTKSLDDLSDALRYAVMAIPWDFSDIQASEESEVTKEMPAERPRTGEELRKEWFLNQEKLEAEMSIEAELDYWNDLY